MTLKIPKHKNEEFPRFFRSCKPESKSSEKGNAETKRGWKVSIKLDVWNYSACIAYGHHNSHDEQQRTLHIAINTPFSNSLLIFLYLPIDDLKSKLIWKILPDAVWVNYVRNYRFRWLSNNSRKKMFDLAVISQIECEELLLCAQKCILDSIKFPRSTPR